ncbi:MAG TPA: phage integrase SAM-like domain-containing protein [Phycisphaerae bacterium]|nr:phage integrase SAM-like domain-containing protein [Phycisphaerae bacterium]
MATLRELCAEYCRVQQYELTHSTRQTARRACVLFDKWAGSPEVAGLSRQAGDGYKNWLVSTGRGKNTANMYLRAIQALCNWAVETDRLAVNPLAGCRQFRVTRKAVTIYEDWQFERMLHCLPRPTKADPDRDLRWLGLLWGARTTGFRRGCLLNLTGPNVRGGMVWVEPKGKTAETWPWEPKDREIRKVPLAPQFAEVLAYFRGRTYPLVAPSMAERLLRWQRDGRPLDDWAPWRKLPELNFRRVFVGIQRRAFGRQIGDWHQFRRTYTTALAEVLPDKAIMELTGHSRRETLDPYTAVRSSHWRAAYECVAGVLKKGPGRIQLLRPSHVTAPWRGPGLEGQGPDWAVQDSNL